MVSELFLFICVVFPKNETIIQIKRIEGVEPGQASPGPGGGECPDNQRG